MLAYAPGMGRGQVTRRSSRHNAARLGYVVLILANLAAAAAAAPPGFDRLWADATAAFKANYAHAASCNAAAMRSDLAKLEVAARKAGQRAEAARGTAAAADAAQYAAAIDSLRLQAAAQPRTGCPGDPPPPPCPYRPATRGECALLTGSTRGVRFTPPDDITTRLLAAHNQARAEVGVGPLVWDRDLAAAAADYGPALSRIGRPVHGPRGGRNCPHENLLQSPRGGRTPEQMVGLWTSEKRFFQPGIFPNVSRSGNWADVAHYTQVVWRATTRVGCAIYSDETNDWLICRYAAPGNIDGRPVL